MYWTPYLIAVIAGVLSYILYRKKNYWTSRGVPSYGNLITGCFANTFRGKENLSFGLERIYSETKHEKVVGTFILGQPLVVLNDPDIIKQVLLTEYNNFASHGVYHDSDKDTLSAHLFNLAGPDWKAVRSKMSPMFSSGKIKSMFEIISSKVQHFEKKLEGMDTQVILFNDYMRRLSIDVICSCLYGIEANSLDESKSEFKTMSIILNMPVFGQLMNFLLFTQFHKLSSFLVGKRITRFFPQAVDDFMIGLCKDLVEYRSESGDSRSDFIDIVVRLQNSARDGKSAGNEDALLATTAAQFFVLFGAGFETTSQTNTIAMYEMAKQPEIMRKVQEECDRLLAESEGKITYDVLSKMQYTEQVIKETLRLYPALQFLIRSAVKPCNLPTTDVKLEKDTNLWIPLLGLHRDPQYFPDPHKFDPERFSPENAAAIPPYVYMPFGEGPRTCIGMRFGLMTIKTVILRILSKYDVSLTEGSPKKIEFEPFVYFPLIRSDVALRLTPRC